MRQRFMQSMVICLVFISLMAGSIQAEPIDDLLKNIFTVPAPTGNEHRMVEKIKEYLPEQSDLFQDNLGSLYFRSGTGGGDLTVVTGMDEYGYFVSGITDDGYLRLDRGVSPPHSLFDAFQHGHAMIVWSENGPKTGAVALPSSHILSRERRQDILSEFTLDNAYLDIGAGSRAEAEKRGIAFLDAVTPRTELHELAGGKISGYALSSKSCTAVLLDLAQVYAEQNKSHNATLIWLAQTKSIWRRSGGSKALGAVRAEKEINSTKILVVDVYLCGLLGQDEIDVAKGPVLVSQEIKNSAFGLKIIQLAKENQINLQYAQQYQSPMINSFINGERDVIGLFLPVRFAGTASEVVDMVDINSLQQLLQVIVSEGDAR